MRSIMMGRWMGVSLLGIFLALGCRHQAQQNCCPAPCGCATTVQQVESPVAPVPAAVNMLPAYDGKKDDRPHIAMSAVAPGMSPGQGDQSGTIELTGAEADKLGVKPGYTPSAMIVPELPTPLPQVPTVQNVDVKTDSE